mgnify:FL=1
MKKVLALVLAVIMVCTMAMAVEVAVTPNEVGSTGNYGEITLADEYDATKTYVLNLKDDFFKVLDDYLVGQGNTADRDAKNFKVEGVSGSFNTTTTGTKVYSISVDNTDRALDGKIDMTISTLRISSVKKTNTYAEFTAKEGKLVLSKLVLGGVSQSVTGVFNTDFWAAYDIGYKTLDANDTNFNWGTEGWFVTGSNGFEATDVTKQVTLKVPAKTAFKFTLADGNASNISDSAIPNGVTKPTTIAVNGYKITAGTLTYKVAGDTNDYFYGVDKNGKLYVSGLTFGVVKDVNGNESGYWTMTTTDARDIVKTNGAIPGVTASTPTTPGTTTNPGTGANDVVGVAAALAVVALVSGAAISLKK